MDRPGGTVLVIPTRLGAVPAVERWSVMHCRRQLSAFVAILSLPLSTATAALWVRSLTAADQLNYSQPTRIDDRYARIDWSVLSEFGFLSIKRARMIPPDDASADWLKKLDSQTGHGWSFGVVDGYPLSWKGFVRGLHGIGFSSGIDSHKVTRRWKSVELPDWLLLLVVSIPAQVAFVRMFRARRARHRSGFPMNVATTARPTGDGA
jgi:hypothetical protein